MVDRKLLVVAAVALLLGHCGPVAAQGGSRLPGNVGIRALEPPGDVRPQQLEAQEPPRPGAAPDLDGAAGGVRDAPARRPE